MFSGKKNRGKPGKKGRSPPNKGRPSPRRGLPLPSICGENHPRWNKNIEELQKFRKRVENLTEIEYKKYKDIINPNNHPRQMGNIEGAYQLDHKISVKYGFDNGISPEVLSHYTNLQILTWKDNRAKWYH